MLRRVIFNDQNSIYKINHINARLLNLFDMTYDTKEITRKKSAGQKDQALAFHDHEINTIEASDDWACWKR